MQIETLIGSYLIPGAWKWGAEPGPPNDGPLKSENKRKSYEVNNGHTGEGKERSK